jgi:hypothetical protein
MKIATVCGIFGTAVLLLAGLFSLHHHLYRRQRSNRRRMLQALYELNGPGVCRHDRIVLVRPDSPLDGKLGTVINPHAWNEYVQRCGVLVELDEMPDGLFFAAPCEVSLTKVYANENHT